MPYFDADGNLQLGRPPIHGHARKGKISPEYRSWRMMIQRCRNDTLDCWKNYGGRGIRVCQRWRDSFEAFAFDMGPRPSLAYSIDRIDNDGDYEPGNCRWATRHQQRMNQRPRSAIQESRL